MFPPFGAREIFNGTEGTECLSSPNPYTIVRPSSPPGCRRSSGVEHSLGKGEVHSSILCGGTISQISQRFRRYRAAPYGPAATFPLCDIFD